MSAMNKQEILEQKSCSCGCGGCSKAPMLNEQLVARTGLSEGMLYHIDNKKPLTEHLFRAGSQKYFDLWAEARMLYSRDLLEVKDDDLAVILETDLGHFGILEDGTQVPLDFIMEDEYLDLNEGTFESDEIAIYDDPKGDAGETRIYKRGTGYYGENDLFDFEAKDKAELEAKLKRWGYVLQAGSLNEDKKKNPPLNKPMRDSSGGKAYKVYVKDPKTGNIKTVRFGSGGLRAKINNPKARQAFAKRHKCSTRNDKTKASYWSCRLPRYAKLLGLKSNFSGFW
jgi:hypothetical protein